MSASNGGERRLGAREAVCKLRMKVVEVGRPARNARRRYSEKRTTQIIKLSRVSRQTAWNTEMRWKVRCSWPESFATVCSGSQALRNMGIAAIFTVRLLVRVRFVQVGVL